MTNRLISASRSRRKNYNKAAIFFIVFSGICLLCALVMSLSHNQIYKSFPTDTGGIIGPFSAPKNNTVFQVKVDHYIRDPKWSFVTMELLDEHKKYIFSFGNEFNFSSGGYGEDAWTEGIKDFSTQFTVKKRGIYYLTIKSENNLGKTIKMIFVTLSRKNGSYLPFVTTGIVFMCIGLLIYYIASNIPAYSKDTKLKKVASRTEKTYIITLLILISVFIFVFFFSIRGWGYPGYYGYHRSGVFFYPAGAGYYYSSPSARLGSVGGPAHRGGGLHGGK